MRLYTRSGDRGRTQVPAKGRVPKSHPRLAAVGDVDELSSSLGAALSLMPPRARALDAVRRELALVQSDLVWAGSLLAFSPRRPPRTAAPDPARLERAMDALCARTPALGRFVLPGGSPSGAFLHLARCVCRRAERSAVALGRETPAGVVAYLNRLSDYLFAAARYANAVLKTPERSCPKSM